MLINDQADAFSEMAQLSRAINSGSMQLSAWACDAGSINYDRWRALMNCRTVGDAATVGQGAAADHWSVLANNSSLMRRNFFALFGATVSP